MSRSSDLAPRVAGLRAAILALALALVAGSAGAHPFLDDRLALIDAQIAAQPGNARLRLSRGSLLLDEHRAHAALADLDRALALDPELSIAHLLRAEALVADGRPEAAVSAATRYLELEPASARGWRTLERVHEARSAIGGVDQLAAALAAFDRYFTIAANPTPDDFLERAALQKRAGAIDDAVAGLRAGVARLGPLTSLLGAALELERDRGHLAAALGFADRLVASSPQTERWQLERARLLAALGRTAEARNALDAARASLTNRPASRRSAPAWSALAREIESAGSELGLEADAAGAPR